jgi:ABC-type sugar transport system ATPase subunit
MTILNFEHVSFGYKPNKLVIENATFALETKDKELGHVVAIMGSSGSGKSTLLRLTAGLERPNEGQVSTDPISPVMSYVPQDSVLFEHLSPLENARYFQNINAYKGKFSEESFAEVRDTLGLEKVLTTPEVGSLSGGERQRLSLLRALSVRPDLLLMDEPLTGLDAHIKLDFLQKLRWILSRQPMLVLYVTHHPSEALLIADEIVYILKQEFGDTASHIIRGSVKDFVEKPAVLEAARLFSDAPLNVLICRRLDSRTLEVTTDSYAGSGHSLKSDEVYLAFKPAVIHTGKIGLPVVKIGNTPVYTYVRMQNGSALTLESENDHGDAVPMRVTLKGPAFVYGPRGTDVKAVNIFSQNEGSECRKIYLSS